MIENVKVYGLDESVIASGYPMSTELKSFDEHTTNIDLITKNYKRAKKLGTADIGSGHDNYLVGIIVQFDLTFSNKAWVEFQRYHFADIVSSCSTIHSISKFDINKQCNEYVDPRIIDVVNELKDKYLETSDPEDYLKLLYNIPSGFQLTARITTNYRQLKTMYYQRKNHRLPEWREFCKWVESLPCFKELCLRKEEE